MRTHVALLRGINVGGTGKVPMAGLRSALTGRGFTDVGTWIQSGNVVLSVSPDSPDGPAEIAATVEAVLREDFAVPRPVVVFGRDEYAAAVAANPFAGSGEPARLHAVFRSAPPSDDDRRRLDAALAAERAAGGRGDAAVVGRVVYLHLPDGLGRSTLAARLTARSGATDGGGTTRNWTTVGKLLELLG
ncbi:MULTISPECIES: DUF1697 domain-containing protein [Pseudonocardia]|uniref:DUF1697 domain-containing protein n=2 Tax=Pseudonocardia TaxID=1847 RepID=A0A1Y2MMR3_PSEAH|nr:MULTISPECIES: DUF1697 domain-containing protein [Pseudonocardia]OSY36546.1 hypothetical protein BG845_05313 [Pseudonocardia autotrophica]TDN76273.1 uncharacterized protein (DUF1697 family) [Pseudonocardia autotrophica]BBG00257.1 hypothetical protein Pdca_14660 [Pseudonocardia autotrophica]GEC29559.1 hypothetical protein PSA01_65880 [Pseudonocardia saturnea]